MALDPLIVLYMYPVPILNTFVRQYKTGALSPRERQIRSHRVEYSIQSIGEVLAAMGALYPRLTGQGELDILL